MPLDVINGTASVTTTVGRAMAARGRRARVSLTNMGTAVILWSWTADLSTTLNDPLWPGETLAIDEEVDGDMVRREIYAMVEVATSTLRIVELVEA